jgi:hypothetical protein
MVNKFLSLDHQLHRVSATFIPTTIHPPTVLSHSSQNIHSIKMEHAFMTSPISIGKDRSEIHPRVADRVCIYDKPTEPERNFSSITSLFSNSTPNNDAMQNNRVMTQKSHSDSWFITNTTLCHPLRGCPEKGQFWTCTSHMHDTCEACQSKMGDASVSFLTKHII